MVTQVRCKAGSAFLLAIILVCIAPDVNAQVPPGEEPIVIKFHLTEGKWVLTVKPDPTPGKGTLWGLATLVSQRGENYPVLALVDDNARISDIGAASGIAAKAGFKNVRTFIVRRELGIMFEIKYCSAVPISTHPPVESTCASAP